VDYSHRTLYRQHEEEVGRVSFCWSERPNVSLFVGPRSTTEVELELAFSPKAAFKGVGHLFQRCRRPRGSAKDRVRRLKLRLAGAIPTLVPTAHFGWNRTGRWRTICSGRSRHSPIASRPILGLKEQLFPFFTTSERSRAAGEAYSQRLKSRVGEIEPPVSQKGIKAQLQALVAWGEGDSAYNHLAEIKQPVLVANGSNDVMVPTINSFTMAQLLPNAQLIVCPDSGHGFLFQYPDLFVDHALRFLRWPADLSSCAGVPRMAE
jgi:pimeloyl-ACP methyl ester carboxylesterase